MMLDIGDYNCISKNLAQYGERPKIIHEEGTSKGLHCTSVSVYMLTSSAWSRNLSRMSDREVVRIPRDLWHDKKEVAQSSLK